MSEAERNLLRLTASAIGVLLSNFADGEFVATQTAARSMLPELVAAMQAFQAEGAPGGVPPSRTSGKAI